MAVATGISPLELERTDPEIFDRMVQQLQRRRRRPRRR